MIGQNGFNRLRVIDKRIDARWQTVCVRPNVFSKCLRAIGCKFAKLLGNMSVIVQSPIHQEFYFDHATSDSPQVDN